MEKFRQFLLLTKKIHYKTNKYIIKLNRYYLFEI